MIMLLLIFKSSEPKYHGLWIFGLILIGLGAISIGISTELLAKTEEWLSRQTTVELIAAGKDSSINLKVWAYVLPGATIALGVNLLTEFLLRRKDEHNG